MASHLCMREFVVPGERPSRIRWLNLMDLSYAQNLEDYHLARVFAGKTDGFYIDVGAGHPVGDNVSFHFYLQGWRGIVVEPQERLCALYDHLRPRDIAACVPSSAPSRGGRSSTRSTVCTGSRPRSSATPGARPSVRRLLSHQQQVRGDACVLSSSHRVQDRFPEGGRRGRRGGRARRRRLAALPPQGGARRGGRARHHGALTRGMGADPHRRRLRLCLLRRAQPLLRRRGGLGPEGALPGEAGAWDAVRHLYEFGRAPGEPAAPRPCAREGARRSIPRGSADA